MSATHRRLRQLAAHTRSAEQQRPERATAPSNSGSCSSIERQAASAASAQGGGTIVDLEFWHENGYVVVPQAVPPENVRAVVDELAGFLCCIEEALSRLPLREERSMACHTERRLYAPTDPHDMRSRIAC